ncbi:MAG: 16S rRNA (cytidine(1402)-2'-O)-methyltransferase [Candidatus Pelethousia sp.]|nr:16S rRNA (cytidine(1402)-2'-O)-methyltransferase [Candidatus Pelethousia sp.]
MGRDNPPVKNVEENLAPMLYLCPTPIGNLEDITLRTIRVLGACAAVYCEDTRRTALLMNHLGFKKPLVACHTHNEAQRADEIAGRVLNGEAVAYVSDAGMPGISDPGERLVRRCIAADVPFCVLPGPSASLTALVRSGLPTAEAVFVGFLPRTGKERRAAIARLARLRGTLIFYESPLRVGETAQDLLLAWGDRPAVLCRELTKVYEEAVRASLSELASRYQAEPPKGECVLLIGGLPEGGEGSAADLDATLSRLLSEGLSAKDAARQASALLDVPRNEAYKRALELKG